jgi:hypothetical protein
MASCLMMMCVCLWYHCWSGVSIFSRWKRAALSTSTSSHTLDYSHYNTRSYHSSACIT